MIIDDICIHEGDVVKVEEGVVAVLDGKYWGVQYSDGHSTERGFGPVENAHVSNPEYCRVPTDMTYAEDYRRAESAKAKLGAHHHHSHWAAGK